MSDERLEIATHTLLYQWNPEIACRTLEETAFILHQSKMVSLNDVGTFIWECFKQACPISDVVAAVVDEFDTSHQEAQKDVEEFVAELLGQDLLVEAPANQEF